MTRTIQDNMSVMRNSIKVLAIVLTVSIVMGSLSMLTGIAAAAGTTDLVVSQSTDTVEPGESVTVEVAVSNADGGVGSADFRIELSDPSVGTITDLTVGNSPGRDESSIDTDGDGANIKYAFDDTQDTGSITIISLSVEADSSGTTSIDVAPNSNGNRVISDELGETYTLQTVESGSLTVAEPQTSGFITGDVADTDGNLIEGIEVAVVDQSTGETVANPRTDSNGEYTVEVPAGDYRVAAGFNSDSYESGSTFVTLEPSSTERGDLRLSRVVSVGYLSGRVTDTSGTEVSDAQVKIKDPSTGDFVKQVQTDANGDYTVELPAGDYQVTADKAGYLTDGYQDITIESGRTTTQNLEVGQLLLPGEISIVSSDSDVPADGSTVATYEVLVRDQNGNPLDGTTVTAEAPSSVAGGGSKATGPDGKVQFEFTSSTPQDARIRFTAGQITSVSTEAVITFSPVSNRPAEVSGIVTNENNERLPNAAIRIQSSGSDEVITRTSANNDGTYTAEVDIGSKGEVVVFATYNGQSGRSVATRVESGRTSTANVEISGVVPSDSPTTSPSPEVSIIASDDLDAISPGQRFEVTYKTRNTGGEAGAGRIEFITPTGVEPVRFSGDGESGLGGSPPSVLYGFSGPIESGESRITTVEFKITDESLSGSRDLTINSHLATTESEESDSITTEINVGNEPPDPDPPTTPEPPERPDYNISFGVEEDVSVRPGGEVDITYSLRNNGDTDLDSAGIDFNTPDAISVREFSGDGRASKFSESVSFPYGVTTVVDKEVTVTYSASDDISSETVEIEATVTGTEQIGTRATSVNVQKSGLPADPGFTDVLQMIESYNERSTYNGSSVRFTDVLQVIEAYNSN